MIAVIDYGAGNLFSVVNALRFLELDCVVTRNKREIAECGSIILPGVGAFPDAKRMLDNSGLTDFLKEQAHVKPFLGICIGAQLLFEKGYEHMETEGLALIPGCVRKIEAKGLKIPHIGWNSIKHISDSLLLASIEDNSFVYFVHSYKIDTGGENIVSYCEYGERIPAVVQRGNVYGTQFHPEKSGNAGLSILRNFGGLK